VGIGSELTSKRRGGREGWEIEKLRHCPGKPRKEVVLLRVGVKEFRLDEGQGRESCVESSGEEFCMEEGKGRRVTRKGIKPGAESSCSKKERRWESEEVTDPGEK
jgi:hypothetical protein